MALRGENWGSKIKRIGVSAELMEGEKKEKRV